MTIIQYPNPLTGITADVFKHMQSPVLLNVLQADIDAGIDDVMLQCELGRRITESIKTVCGDTCLISDLAKAGAHQIDYQLLVEQLRVELLRTRRREAQG